MKRILFNTEKEMLESGRVCTDFDFGITRDLAKSIGSKRIIFSGMGSSTIFPGKNAKNRALKLDIGNKVEAYPSSDLFQYEDFSNTFLFLCSNSGRTKETVLLQEHAKRYGATCIAVTALADSLLAQKCDGKIILSCGFEKGVAATKSVVEQGLICESLIFNLAKLQGMEIDFEYLKRELTDAREKIVGNINFRFDRQLLKKLASCQHYYFVGLETGVAQEITLKANEIVRKPATFYPDTQILHGPAEAINGGCVIIFESPEFSQYLSALRDFSRKTGCLLLDVDLPGIEINETFRNYCLLSAGWGLLRSIARNLKINMDCPQRISKVAYSN